DITERKQVEAKLRAALDEARQRRDETEALFAASRAMLGSQSFEQASRSIFNAFKSLSGATSGYLSLVVAGGSQDQLLFMDTGGSACSIDPDLHLPMRGLREEADKLGRPVYDNDVPRSSWRQDIPEEHAPLDNVLIAPLVIQEKTVGLLGLANKQGGFTENDVRLAVAFSELLAIAYAKHLAEEGLRQAHEELEHRVEERTAELTALNQKMHLEIRSREQAEEQIRQTQIRLKTLIDSLTDPLIMVNREMQFKTMNQAALNYYGLANLEDINDLQCYGVYGDSMTQCPGCDIPAAVLNGEPLTCERLSPRNSERTEEVHVYPLAGGANPEEAAVIRIHDITETRMMERRLVQGEKLASLGLLVAGVAHEINNPNNFITFNIPILRKYVEEIIPILDDYARTHPDFSVLRMSYQELRTDIFKLLDNLEHGSRRINETVSALRSFARDRGAGEKSPVKLKQVIDKVLSFCQAQLRKNVRNILVEVPKDLPPLVTDPLALEQVLVNMLINAAQAADKEDSWVKLRVTRGATPEDDFVIEISDNGKGMDKITQRKIFDPFFTTKGMGVGTGMGLSISHRLVQELGGHIEVASKPGEGSTFKVMFSGGEANNLTE
ncbi:MAG: ATP-binding protein, partial [Desulfobaccales bacterium]